MPQPDGPRNTMNSVVMNLEVEARDDFGLAVFLGDLAKRQLGHVGNQAVTLVMSICSLTSAGTPFRGALEGLDRALEIEGRGDERLEVDLARADEVERPLVHIGVAEDRLDPQLLADRARNIERDGINRNADQDDRARRTGKADRALDRLRGAARVEHDIGAPISGLRLHGLGKIALR